jgi:hypothetical protein
MAFSSSNIARTDWLLLSPPAVHVIVCSDITIWLTHVICLRHFDWLLVRLQPKCRFKFQWHVETIAA